MVTGREDMRFVADPPPAGGDPVLVPWAVRQFEALQRRTGGQASATQVQALEAEVQTLEARVQTLEASVQTVEAEVQTLNTLLAGVAAIVGDGTWDGGTP